MIVTNKLYRKDFNQYSEDDWKYIFSIYTLRDKYNFTEEEFLAAELVDKTAMMKKMDDVLYTGSSIIIDEHDKPLVDSCPEDEGCKVIQDFLDNNNKQNLKPVHDPLFCKEGDIPACNPLNDCSVIQDFIGEEDGSYDEYLRIKRDSLRSILYEEDRIQELVIKLKEHMLIIKNCKEEIDSAFAKYISTQWQ